MAIAATDKPSWQEAFGEAARVVPERVGLKTEIMLDWRFVQSVLRNVLAHSKRDPTRSNLDAFATQALEAWVQQSRSDADPMTRDRVQEVERLIPSPRRGHRRSRIRANLQGRVTETAFSRILAQRTESSPRGKRWALKEALLQAILGTLKAAPAESSPRQAGMTDGPVSPSV